MKNEIEVDYFLYPDYRKIDSIVKSKQLIIHTFEYSEHLNDFSIRY